MENDNVNRIMLILEKAIKDNNYYDDNNRVIKLYNLLSKLNIETLNIETLEFLSKEIVYLETEYDEFNELSYYFNPLYVKIKRRIHSNDVKKIREKNKIKEQ